MDQRQNTTPSKLSTRYFPPNKWQVLGSAYYVRKPQRKLSPFYAVLLLIGVFLITYALVWGLTG